MTTRYPDYLNDDGPRGLDYGGNLDQAGFDGECSISDTSYFCIMAAL